MIVDEEFKQTTSSFHMGAVQVPSITGAMQKQQLTGPANMVVRRNGWLYVYVSNESNQDVFFDDLIINHKRGPVVEMNNYYAFGLEIPGLNSKAVGFGGNGNRRKFNGGNELQSKEFSDGSGLELYDAVHRMYDPQIGRFMQLDPLEGLSLNFSPYVYAGNNPLTFNDPFGLLSTKDKPQELAEVIVIGHRKPKPFGGFYWPSYTKKDVQEQTNLRGQYFQQKDNGLEHPLNAKFEPYRKSFEREYEANQDWKKNNIAALLLIGSPLVLTTSPIASQLVLGTETALKARIAITAGDAALQLLEKGKINPVQAFTSSFGPLTYALGAATTFNWHTGKVGIDENASATTIAVSTVFNVIGMKMADRLAVANAPIPVIGLTTTVTSVWGDGANSIITGNSFIQPPEK